MEPAWNEPGRGDIQRGLDEYLATRHSDPSEGDWQAVGATAGRPLLVASGGVSTDTVDPWKALPTEEPRYLVPVLVKGNVTGAFVLEPNRGGFSVGEMSYSGTSYQAFLQGEEALRASLDGDVEVVFMDGYFVGLAVGTNGVQSGLVMCWRDKGGLQPAEDTALPIPESALDDIRLFEVVRGERAVAVMSQVDMR